MFRVHLLEQLKSWLDESNNVILCIAENENMIHSILARGLRAQVFRNTVRSHCDIDIGRTLKSRGTEHTDAIWVSAGIEIHSDRFMPSHEGAGDHLACIINVSQTSAIGTARPKIRQPPAR